MRTFIYVFIVISVLFACTKEDSLVSSEVKEWYVITPSENMDEVDEMIYELYQKYDLAVFYEDTIGSEDRGWKDENGDPKLYYEVLRLDYDMTVDKNDVGKKITYEKIDISILENKKAILPLLKLMDEKLFVWLQGVDIFIPAILVVQHMEKKNKPMYAYRGFGLLAFAIDGYDKLKADSIYQREFLHEVSYSALQDSLVTFYAMVSSALENTSAGILTKNNCWESNYNNIISSYVDWNSQLKKMESYMEDKSEYEEEREELLKQLEDEGLTEEEREELESKLKRVKELIAGLEKQLKGYDELLANMEESRPENFGFLNLNEINDGFYVPSKLEDFGSYLDAVLDYKKDEFMEKYKNYPYVQGRYTLAEYVLRSAGFDLEKIRNDIK